jgi:hypothetical protein
VSRKGEAYIGGHSLEHKSPDAGRAAHPPMPRPDLPGGEMRTADYRRRLIERLEAAEKAGRLTRRGAKMLRYYRKKEEQRRRRQGIT